MTKRAYQRSRIKIPGQTKVRNPTTGNIILCAWDTCDRPGFDEIKFVVKEPTKNLHYIFCSERHKRYHLHGHRDYGKLST